MSIELVTTAYGQPASEALARAVNSAKRGDPLARVTVVVPTNYAGLAARRALARRGSGGDGGASRGVAAVAAVTAFSLAERLGGEALADQGRSAVSNAVIAGAVRSVLRSDPGRFAGVETHPATCKALSEAHRELSELSDQQIESLRGRSMRAREVVRIHRQVAAALRDRFSNEQELSYAAVEAVRADPVAAQRKLGSLVVFLPQRLSPSQARLIGAASEAVDATVIAGFTGASDADAAVSESLTRLGLEQASTDLSLVNGGGSVGQAGIRALSVSDADEEVRHAVRAVVDAARRGVPLGRCAILYGTSDPYERLVCDALDTAEIARCGASALRPATSWLGRCLLDLLELGEQGLSRTALMAWLNEVHLWMPNSSGTGRIPAPVAAWERVARAAGVTGGIDDWNARLGLLAQDRRAESQRPFEEERLWLRQRLTADADHAERLRAFVAELDGRLVPPARRSWASFAAWCDRLINAYLGGRHRQKWPSEERRLAEVVDAAVKRLADLDGIDDGPSLSAFRQALEAELDGTQHRHGRFGSGVLVGGVASAVGVDLDLLVVCGMAEGMFPARRRESSLLPDRERRDTDLAVRGDRTGDDHRALLAMLASASSSLLLFPRGDLRHSAERAPSRWLSEIEQRQQLEEVPSFVTGLRRMSFATHEQEYDVRAALDWHDERGPLAADNVRDEELAALDALRDSVFGAKPHLWRGVEMSEARACGAFTRFDGNIAAGDSRGARLRSLFDEGETTSASRLEAWTKCPHAYLVRHVLGVDAIEDEADSIRISPLELGNLIHRILERWVARAMQSGELPAAGKAWSDAQTRRLLVIGEEECDALEARGLVGRRLYWNNDRRRILADLRRFVDFDNAQRAMHRSAPVAAELGFGMPDGEHGPVEITLDDQRRVYIRGSIDRLDLAEDGALVVIDYKTGSIRRYKDLSDEDPKPEGGHLQLVLYALAARQLPLDDYSGSAEHLRGDTGNGDAPVRVPSRDHGAYWFVSSRSSSSGGFETRGYEVEVTRARVLDAVRGIVDGISAGVFPARPEPGAWGGFVACRFCEPDGLGVREQLRDWQRKRRDPALAGYVALIGEAEASQ